MSRRSSAIEWRTQSRLIRRSSAGSNPRPSRSWIVVRANGAEPASDTGDRADLGVPGS